MSDPLHISLPDETATVALAEDLAAMIAPGDLIALHGDLGAGKSTLARALIRAIADDAALEVPSPTFTLVQTYATRIPVAHLDLYRLGHPDELDELGLDEALATGAALVEWPGRAGDRLPDRRLDIALAMDGDGRTATISGDPTLVARFTRSRAIRAFLDKAGWTGAARRHLQGDTSTRRYERLHRGGRTAVVMDWPPHIAPQVPDPRVMFRARDLRPVIAVDEALRALGLSAPAIHAADVGAGFLLTEDLGSVGIAEDGTPVPERYRTAIDALAMLHASPRPDRLPLPDGSLHALPRYTAEALAIETTMFVDWYVPHATGKPATEAMREEYARLWEDLIGRLAGIEQGWVLLDYHSPNLFWLAERTGLARLGIIDFQDLMMGPSAYDVASLCQDARVTVPPALEAELTARYVAARKTYDAAFDADAFAEAYAILTVQRATKNFGIFTRLADGAGNRGYLRHIPRLREYLERSLAHPALSGYALRYRKYLSSPSG